MNRALIAIAALLAVLFLVACARPPSSMPGFITLNVTEMDDYGNGKIGPKMGKACTTSLLGWITKGDSGIKAAAANGGITQVNSVDYTSSTLLGITGEHCTVVYGN